MASPAKIGVPVVGKPGTKALKRKAEDKEGDGGKKYKSNQKWDDALSQLQAVVDGGAATNSYVPLNADTDSMNDEDTEGEGDSRIAEEDTVPEN